MEWQSVVRLLLLLLCTDQTSSFGAQSSQQRHITVKKGRPVALHPRELNLVSSSHELCKVEVVLNDPMTQRVGKVTPKVFDCDFQPYSVKYTHNGNPLLKKDTIKLEVHRFTDTDTITTMVTVNVNIVDAPYEIFVEDSRLGHLKVKQFFGLSNEIDASVLRFRYNYYSGATCTIQFSQFKSHLPQIGQIVLGPEQKAMNTFRHDCRDLLYMGLQYKHMSPPTPDTDYLPLSVEVNDPVLSDEPIVEHLYLPIHIGGAFPNTPPEASFLSSFVMEVDQFVMTPIDPEVMGAKDAETPMEQLVFNITKPPGIREGFFVHLSDHTKPVSSFLQSDLMNNDIAFHPPDFSYREKKVLDVEFIAYDTQFAASQPITLHIAIRPTSSPAPRVVVNTGLFLVEGQSRPILPGNFHVVDSDNPEDVKIYVKGGLRHGRLQVNGRRGFLFTPSDLEAGHVIYSHDDSDAVDDKILLRIHDGSHTVRTKFPISILPKDDSAPYLINNLGLEVREGGYVQITSDHLSAHDKDSQDLRIIYLVRKPPQAGEIVKKYRPLTVGQKVAKFNQLEISRGLIYYHHLGGEIHEDSFDFRLMDEHEPPNKSGKYSVNVIIQPVNDQPPHQVKGTSRQLMVDETKSAYITREMLQYEDDETPEENLIYTVTNQPFFLTTTITIDAGKLVPAENLTYLEKNTHIPAVHSFSQADIDFQRIAYMPPYEDVGPIRRHARFTYTVSDKEGNELLEQYFDITILPVNNQVPHMSVQRMRVREGGAVALSPSDVSVYDPDTDQDSLVFTLSVLPKSGRLLRDEVTMVTGQQFRLSELTGSSMRYIHDGSEVTDDSFTLQVSDGVNTVTKVINIGVQLVNDHRPQVVSGLTNVIQVEEGGEMAITTEHLAAKDSDSDSDNSDLTFVVVRSTQYGHIEVLKQKVDQFSQKDVGNGVVHYVHTGGEIGMDPVYDSATFAVSDGSETGLSDRPLVDLNITILPRDDASPHVILGGPLFVNEGETVPITFEVLSAQDVDTPLEHLMFEVSKQPDWGYILVNRPEPGSEIVHDEAATSFHVVDVKQGNVLYVQSNHKEAEPVSDAFEVYVTDGNSHSPPTSVQINIVPRNDEIPQFHVGDLTVVEGGEIILNPTVFKATDGDLPAEKLVVSVATPPKHGKLGLLMQSATQGVMIEVPMHDVTMEDLTRDMQLFYKHDGSEHQKDEFSLKVTDGQHTIKKTSHVRMVPMNDERPQILKKSPLNVNFGGAGLLSNVVLQTVDSDDSEDHVFFVILEAPKIGVLQLRRYEIFSEDDYETIEGSWMDVGVGMNFTQDDVNMNQVRYVHTEAVSRTGTDFFVFQVTDGTNKTPKETFEIVILNSRVADINLVIRVMNVREGDSKVITTDLLSASDRSSKVQDITFHITRPPSQGHLAFITEKSKPISSFTQMDLAAQKIVYIHSNKADVGQDSFSFKVVNSINDTRSGVFRITIETVDRALPTLDANVPLTVVQGSVATLTAYNLHTSDPDTSPLNLTYIITDPPQHGSLLRRGSKITNTFTQFDINNKFITYHSNGSDDSGIDFFLFTISDSHHDGYLINGSLESKPSFFSILIQPLSKEPPRLPVKQKPDLLEDLGEGKYGFLLTQHHLRASHPSCGAADLLYTMLEKPINGYLENMATHKLIKKRFSQQDIDQGKVAYVLNDGMYQTNDSFTFRVQDAFRNTLDNQKFTLEWAVIEIAQPHYIVCEDAGTLPLTVTRSGALHGSSFVDIRSKEMSASEGIDYKPSSLAQLQFDPGETSVTWEIEIVNDGFEENNEKLRVLLKNPVNAVLGGYDKSSVQIINLKNGHCAEYIGMISRDQPTPAENLPISYAKSKDSTLFSYHGISPIQKSDTDTYGDLEDPEEDNEEEKHKAQKERKRRRKKKGKGRKRKGKKGRKHPNRVGTEEPDMDPPTVAADSAMGMAPHPCTKDTKGLLYFDLRSARMYRCNSISWEQWDQSQVSNKMFKTSPTSYNKDVPPKKKDCPTGWARFRDDCFKGVTGKVTWSSGERRCQEEYEGHLAHVESHKHLEWLWKLAENQPFWIGLNDRRSHHVWEYSHGGQVQFYHWRKGFPRSQRALAKNCVLVSHRAEWVNRPCERNLARFICSKPIKGVEHNQYKSKGKRRRRHW